MARDKEKTLNPATAALKSQKQAHIKKQKAALAAQRSERLAHRNPDRLQRQIDDLQALKDSSGGKLKPRDEQALHSLERDVRLIKKARGRDGGDDRSNNQNQPDDTQKHGGRGNPSSLGKRRRGSDHARHDRGRASDSEETDPEVRNIPMPRDTPPPIPPRRGGRGGSRSAAQPAKPVVEAKKSYSAAPQMRNLRQEAVNKFVPAVVAARAKAKAGPQQPMLEPEEADALEQAEEQQRKRIAAQHEAEHEAEHEVMAGAASGTAADDEANVEARLQQAEREARKQQHGAGEDMTADAGKAADEAEAEAVHEMMADGARTGAAAHGDDQATDRRLHQVEIEEADDDDDDDDGGGDAFSWD